MNDNEQRSVLEQLERGLSEKITPGSEIEKTKLPAVLWDFHMAVDKLIDLKEKMSDPTHVEGLSDREKADGFIAASVVNSVLDKADSQTLTDYGSTAEILSNLGIDVVTGAFLDYYPLPAEGETDPSSKNEYLSDSTRERLSVYYDNYGGSNDSAATCPDYAHCFTKEETADLEARENSEDGRGLEAGKDRFGHEDYTIRSIAPTAESFLTSISVEDKKTMLEGYMSSKEEHDNIDAENKRVDGYLSGCYISSASEVIGKESATGAELTTAAGWLEKGGAASGDIEAAHMKAASAYDKEGNKLEAYREYEKSGSLISAEEKNNYLDKAIQDAVYEWKLDERVGDNGERLVEALENTHDPKEIREVLKDADYSAIPEDKREEVKANIEALLTEKEESLGVTAPEEKPMETGKEDATDPATAPDNKPVETGKDDAVAAPAKDDNDSKVEGATTAENDPADKDATAGPAVDKDGSSDSGSGITIDKNEAEERNARNSEKYEADGKYESAYLHAVMAGDKISDDKKAELLDKAVAEVAREEFGAAVPDSNDQKDKEQDLERAISDKNTDGIRSVIESVTKDGKVPDRLEGLLSDMDNPTNREFKPEEVGQATGLVEKGAAAFVELLKDDTVVEKIRAAFGDEKAEHFKDLMVQYAGAMARDDKPAVASISAEMLDIVKSVPEKNDVDRGAVSKDSEIMSRILELGRIAYIDPHNGRAIRYQSRNPYQMMAVLDYCKYVRGIDKDDYKVATGHEKPEGLWKASFITTINLFNSISLSNISAVWSEALYQEFLKDAKNEADGDKDTLVAKARAEVVKADNAVKISDVLKDDKKELTVELKKELGDEKFEKFKEAVDNYAKTGKNMYAREANRIVDIAQQGVQGNNKNERFDRRDFFQNWDILKNAIDARREGREINFTITGRGTETGPVSRTQVVMAFINLIENSDLFYTVGKIIYERIQEAFFTIFDEKQASIGDMIEKAVADPASKPDEKPDTVPAEVGTHGAEPVAKEGAEAKPEEKPETKPEEKPEEKPEGKPDETGGTKEGEIGFVGLFSGFAGKIGESIIEDSLLKAEIRITRATDKDTPDSIQIYKNALAPICRDAIGKCALDTKYYDRAITLIDKMEGAGIKMEPGVKETLCAAEARIEIDKRHPDMEKAVHLLDAAGDKVEKKDYIDAGDKYLKTKDPDRVVKSYECFIKGGMEAKDFNSDNKDSYEKAFVNVAREEIKKENCDIDKAKHYLECGGDKVEKSDHVSLGDKCMEKGDFTSAIECYTKGGLDQKDERIQAALGKEELKKDNPDLDKAKDHLDAAGDKADKEDYTSLGEKYEEKGQHEKAIECYEKSGLDARDERVETAHAAAGKEELAKDNPDLEKAKDHLDAAGDHADKGDYDTLGGKYEEKGQHEKAIECWEKAGIDSHEDKVESAHAAAGKEELAKESPDLDKARDHLEAAGDKAGKEEYSSLGEKYMENGQNEQAIECFGKAGLDAKDERLELANAGAAKDELGKEDPNLDSAKDHLEAAGDKADKEDWESLGEKYAEKDQPEQAIECFEKSGMSPDDDRMETLHADVAKAELSKDDPDLDKTKDHLDAAGDHADKDDYATLGDKYEEKGQHDQAIECFAKGGIDEHDDRVESAHAAMGREELGKEDPNLDGARDHMDSAGDHADKGDWETLGGKYEEKGQYEQAIACWNKAGIDPDDDRIENAHADAAKAELSKDNPDLEKAQEHLDAAGDNADKDDYHVLGEKYEEKGQMEKAEECEKSYEVLAGREELQKDNPDLEKAQGHLNAAGDKADSADYEGLANKFEEKGMHKEALANWEKAGVDTHDSRVEYAHYAINAIELAHDIDSLDPDNRPEDAADIYSEAIQCLVGSVDATGDDLRLAADWMGEAGYDSEQIESTHAKACEAYAKEGDIYNAYKEAVAAKEQISPDTKADAVEAYAKDSLQAARNDTGTYTYAARLFDMLPAERQTTPEAREAFEKGAEQMNRRSDVTRSDIEAAISWAGKVPGMDPDRVELLEHKLEEANMNYDLFAKDIIEPVLQHAIEGFEPIDFDKFYEEVHDGLAPFEGVAYKDEYSKEQFVDDVRTGLAEIEKDADNDDPSTECDAAAIEEIRNELEAYEVDNDLVDIDEGDKDDIDSDEQNEYFG